MQRRYARSLIIYLLVILLTTAALIPATLADDDSTAPAIDDGTATEPETSPTPSAAVADAADATSSVVEPSSSAPETDDGILSLDMIGVGKSTYLEGEYFDPDGYILRATYSDGTHEDISAKAFDYSPKGRLITDSTSEDVTVEFTYKGKTKRAYVTVKRPTALKVALAPTKTEYNEGASFDPSGMLLFLEYPDGSRRIIENDEYTVHAPDALTHDITSIEVSAYGRTASIEGIKVAKIAMMLIVREPDKTVYYEGEAFDPTGLIIIATFENNTSNRILTSDEYTVSAPLDHLTPNSSDRQKLELVFSVGEFSQTLELTVYGFESFVFTMPNKTDYYYGDVFSADGFAAKAKYVNGDERDITAEVTISAPEVMDVGSDVRVNYFDYEEVLLSVHEARMIHFKTLPSSLEFREGTTLTENTALNDMVITVEYDDGTELPLDASEYSISPARPLTLTDTKMTVTYRGMSAILDMTVLPSHAVSSIRVTHAPFVTSYISNQTLDLSGLEVTVTYEDGTEEPLPLDKLEITPSAGSQVRVTDTQIKLVYRVSEKLVYTTTQTIEVSPQKVISLSILTPPTKRTYTEGERFDPAGMTVLAVYNDGTSAQISAFTCSPSEILTLTTDAAEETISITVSYVDCTATQNITVKERVISSIEVAQNPTKLEYAPGERFDSTGLIIKINYADGTTALVDKTTDVEFSPNGALTLDTKEMTLTFRRMSLTIPITVREASVTTGEITTEPTPTETTAPISPETTTPNTVHTPTTTPNQTTSNPLSSNIMVIWAAMLAVIIILLVVVIIYYKRNFT